MLFKKFISAFLSASCLMCGFAFTVSAMSVKELAIEKDHVSESKSSHDPSELANTITSKLATASHPYILYSKEDIPSLQEKVNSGLSKKAYERVLITAESYLTTNISVNSSSSGVIGRQLQSYVTYLSVAGMISGDSQFTAKAVQLVTTAAMQGNIDIYFGINDALSVGDFGHAYALAYDWLYDAMTEDQRSLIRGELEEIGEWIYTNSPEIDTWGSQLDRRKAWNWNAVTHGALGLISLSLGDRPEWLALSIRRTTDYYDFAVDDTGAAMEGLHYVGYGLNSLTPFDGAIYRLTGIELMDDYPEMQKMPAWSMLYMTLPQGGRQAAIGQATEMGNYSTPYYIINRYSLSNELWGFEHTYSLSGDSGFESEYTGNGWSCPAIIFFEDQTLTPQAPTSESHPLIKEFEKGLVIAKDSWDNDAAMLTFTCGVGFAGCWNHPDDNTFTFSARGDAFVVDLGAGKLTPADHNVVHIDGVGMSYEGGATMIAGDFRENKTLENGNLYLRGSNVDSYWKAGLKDSTRHIVFAGGEVPFVIVYDYVRKDSDIHTYTTNFHIDPNAEIEVAPSARYATIKGAESGEICYVIPGSTDFVFLSSNGICITSETESIMLCQATVFIMSNPDGSMPEVDFEPDGKDFTVTLTRIINGENVTETYTFGFDSLNGFTTTEKLPELNPDDTETDTDAPTGSEETESLTEVKTETETETETESTTLPESKVESESLDETEKDQTSAVETTAESEKSTSAIKDSGNSKNSSGCSSSAAAAMVPVIAAGAAIATVKKKKKE